jgi:hypothetical protein
MGGGTIFFLLSIVMDLYTFDKLNILKVGSEIYEESLK